MCESKLIFSGPLLDKLTKNCVLSMNDKLVKQIEGCPMGGAISVIMSGIHMKRMEKDCVAPLNQKLYKRYVDDKRTKRKKNTWNDKLFANPNSHHKNIKVTVETNQIRFLDLALNVNSDGSVTTKVFQKPGKFPAFSKSQIPKWCKRNNVNGDIYQAFKIGLILMQKFLSKQRNTEIGLKDWILLNQQLCLQNFKKKDEKQPVILDWLFEVFWNKEISLMLKDLLIEFKALLEAKQCLQFCGQLETLNLCSHLKTKLCIDIV